MDLRCKARVNRMDARHPFPLQPGDYMSEQLFSRWPAPELVVGGQAWWLFAALISGLTLTAASAEDVRKDNASRLGFRFDQQAHDAAVAKQKSRDAIFAAEPSDSDAVRLPRYTVTEDRVEFDERDILTPKGELDLAKKRYLKPTYQKTVGPLMAIPGFLHNPLGGFKPNAPEARAIYEDFETLRRKNRMAELTDLSELADKAKSPKTKPTRKRKKAKAP